MKYIVSLTSFGDRIEHEAPYSICSILNQDVLPDRVILWLAYDSPVPKILKDFSEIGLEINFCEDLKSYKKLVPAILKFPNDVLVTADDDVIYPKNWFAQLKHAYLKDPTRIYSHRAREIQFDDNSGILLPYKNWTFCVKNGNHSDIIFPTGVGGILYPPNSLYPTCVNSDEFLKLAPAGDDIWFWAMAKLAGTRHSIIENGYNSINSIFPNRGGLWLENVNNGGNDIQLERILKRFPALRRHLQMNRQKK